MKLLIVNGPNLNLLGKREPEIYGEATYADLCRFIEKVCAEAGVTAEIVQSNHEGVLVDAIQEAAGVFDAIVINAAAYTHTSIALLDALRAVALPAVEVHLTDTEAREDFRRVSYLRAACFATCAGKGFDSYRDAIAAAVARCRDGGK